MLHTEFVHSTSFAQDTRYYVTAHLRGKSSTLRFKSSEGLLPIALPPRDACLNQGLYIESSGEVPFQARFVEAANVLCIEVPAWIPETKTSLGVRICGVLADVLWEGTSKNGVVREGMQHCIGTKSDMLPVRQLAS